LLLFQALQRVLLEQQQAAVQTQEAQGAQEFLGVMRVHKVAPLLTTAIQVLAEQVGQAVMAA
jgi:hypothetical protein